MHNIIKFSQVDKKHNTEMLKEIPSLLKTTAITVGNAIFAPAQEENKEYKTISIDIEGKPHIFITTETDKPQNISNIVPAESFDYEGISLIFKQSGIPTEFKKYVFALAMHRQDVELLHIAFTEDEVVKISNDIKKNLISQ